MFSLLCQNSRQAIGAQARVVNQERVHLGADKAEYIISRPARLDETFAKHFQTLIAQGIGAPREGAFVDSKKVGRLTLTQPMPQPQTEQQDFIVVQAAKPSAGRLGKNLAPAAIALGGHGQREIIVGKRLDAGVAAQLGNMPVLKDANEPRDQRAIAVVTGEHRKSAGRLRDEEVPQNSVTAES